jgi:hypothetical protein
MNHEAVYALYPNVVSINGTTPYDANGNEVTVDLAAVDAWISPDQYKRDRVAKYPPIGDQLDALFHAGVFPAEMAATIQAVKDAHPKPTEGDA